MASNPSSTYSLIRNLTIVLILTLFAAGFTFFFTLRSRREIQVPNVVGVELSDALIQLQELDLFPFIRLRYSDNPDEKGHVLSQQPIAGAVVRTMRRIDLLISRGTIIDRVGNWVGKNITDVRNEVALVANGPNPLITIDTLVYEFDESLPGTVLAQNPAPQTLISGHVSLQLVISRGEEIVQFTMPQLVDLDYRQAIDLLIADSIPFTVALDRSESASRQRSANDGLIVSQSPGGGSISQAGTNVIVTMRPPTRLPADHLFGIFELVLPIYPVALPAELISIPNQGEQPRSIASIYHTGGLFTMPYVEKIGSTLTLLVDGEEVARQIVSESESETETDAASGDGAASASGAGFSDEAASASGAGSSDEAASASGAGSSDEAASASGADSSDEAASASGAGSSDEAASASGAGSSDEAASASGAGSSDDAASASGANSSDEAASASGAGSSDDAASASGAGSSDESGFCQRGGLQRRCGFCQRGGLQRRSGFCQRGGLQRRCGFC